MKIVQQYGRGKVSYARHRDAIFAAIGRKPPEGRVFNDLPPVAKAFNEMAEKELPTPQVIAGKWIKDDERTLRHIDGKGVIHKLQAYGLVQYNVMYEGVRVFGTHDIKDALRYYRNNHESNEVTSV